MIARSSRRFGYALAGALSLVVTACGGTDGRGEIIDETGGSGGSDDAAAPSLGGGGQEVIDAGKEASKKDVGSAIGNGDAGPSDDGGGETAAPEAETGGAVCGNQIVEPGEDCDDGNALDGDGCSSTCLDSKCCEECEAANGYMVDNSRDPVSGVFVLFPSCDAFLDAETARDGNAVGTKKKDLCYAVSACIERTHCAAPDYAEVKSGNGGPTYCYCGSTPIADCKKAGGPKGPCTTQIENGLETTDPTVVLSRLYKVQYGAGGPLSRSLIAHDYCTTLNGGHHECYRPAGSADPYPACDMFGVDAGGIGGSGGEEGTGGLSGAGGTGGLSGAGGPVDSGSADAALDAVADHFEGGGGFPDSSVDSSALSEAATDAAGSEASFDATAASICSNGKNPPAGSVCIDCEAAWCPRDVTGCGAGSCAATSSPRCSDYPSPADQALCDATLDCARRTNCAANGISTCFCGTQPVGYCRGGQGNGVCKAEIIAGLKTSDSEAILSSLSNPAQPGGGAMKLVQCDHDFCGSMNDANNECMPYCQ